MLTGADDCGIVQGMEQQGNTWIGTTETAERLGIGLRTLYRLIDSGELAAYKFGRVIRLKATDVDAYIDGARIRPGELEHLYPTSKG